jgi:hypothetical protein
MYILQCMISWLEIHLLPCGFKSIFGIDCPGCGFQRSVIALLKGNLSESLGLYPATIPLLITCVFLLLKIKYHFDKNEIIKKSLLTTVAIIILVSYSIKIWAVYKHHSTSI